MSSSRTVAMRALRPTVLLLGLFAASIALGSCGHHSSSKDWTSYEDSIRDNKALLTSRSRSIADLDQNCLVCHENARDPHGSSTWPAWNATAAPEGTTIEAHPSPKHPERWKSPRTPSAPTLSSTTRAEWIKFVNPRPARRRRDRGGCHDNQVLAVAKSTMTNSAPFWGMAAYANGIAPFKRTVFGESYSLEGLPADEQPDPQRTAACDPTEQELFATPGRSSWPCRASSRPSPATSSACSRRQPPRHRPARLNGAPTLSSASPTSSRILAG